MDIIGGLIPKRTIHRLFAIAVFAALIYAFRGMLVLLVFFVAFERLIGVPATFLGNRTRVPYKVAVVTVAVAWLAGFGGAVTFGVLKAVQSYKILKVIIPEKIASLTQTPAYHAVQEHFGDAGTLIEKAQHYASGAVGYLATLGHILIFAVVGFVLAFVYLLERVDIEAFSKKISPRTLQGTLVRWFSFVTEAIAVTLQFQVVVAVFNSVTTYPVLLLLGIPNATALMVGIFFSGLVPVVGNFAMGVLLTIMAYQVKGWVGVVVFTVLTFVLHKVESYYLSPRLAQRHVRIPSFLLLVSLIAWEHLIGFLGLLVSFPFLFVVAKILDDLKHPPPDPFARGSLEPEKPPEVAAESA